MSTIVTFLLVFCLLLTAGPDVHAQDEPWTPPAADATPIPIPSIDLSDIPNLPGRNSFTKGTASKSQTFKKLGPAIFRINIAGDVVPIVVSQDDLNMPELQPFNEWLNGVTPYTISDWFSGERSIIPYTDDNRESAKYCAKLVVDGFEPMTFLTRDTTQVSDNIPGSQEFLSSAQLLGSAYGLLHKIPSKSGRLSLNLPPTQVHDISDADCAPNYTGDDRPQILENVKAHAAFPDGSGFHTRIGTVIADAFGNILELFIKARLDVYKKFRAGHVDLAGCLHGYGCGGKDTIDQFYEYNRNSPDGWVATLIAESQKKVRKGYAVAADNAVHLGDAKKIKLPNPVPALNRAIGGGLQEAACAVSPDSAQDTITLDSIGTASILEYCRTAVSTGIACTLEGTNGQITGNVSSAVNTAAHTIGIPRCVLDAVATIEGAYDPNKQCIPNECGAVGPFDITVGYTLTGQNGQCTKDTSCSQCPAGSCPTSFTDYFSGTTYTEKDLCDAEKSAEMAAIMLKGKAGYFGADLSGTDADVGNLVDAIIFAGNAYYGSNHVFTSGSNIVPGCSYGESILVKYCGYTGYTCGTRNHPVN